MGVTGRDGRVLDVGMTMETLKQTMTQVADKRTLALTMLPLEPSISDPEPLLEAARSAPLLLTVNNLPPTVSANSYTTPQATAISGNVIVDDTGSGVDGPGKGDPETIDEPPLGPSCSEGSGHG